MFKRIAIIGCGVIGASIARAVRANLPEAYVVAVDTDQDTRDFLQSRKIAQLVLAKAEEGVHRADLVVLATPISALADVAQTIAPALEQGAVVTDIASVKQAAVAAIAPALPEHVTYIPGHPIAGSEQSGAAASEADLFLNRLVVLTPEDPHLPEVKKLAEFWQALGARLEYMPAELHDKIYATVSHLPQLLSFNLKKLFSELHVSHEGSDIFQRFIRLTGSSETLWTPIFHENTTNISAGLSLYIEALDQIMRELKAGGAAHPADSTISQEKIVKSLFPRIVASCLISTAARQEKTLGVPLKSFAGPGFKDFTAPLEAPPEGDLEAISGAAPALAAILEKFAAMLRESR